MEFLIILGAKYLFAIVVLGACLALPLLPFDQRKTYLLRALVAGVLAIALTKMAGLLYVDPRPFTHGVTPLFAHDPDNGFPSDHTVLSVAAALFALTVSKQLGAALLVLAVLVALCRVLAGVHHPIDVIAGGIIGMAAVGVAVRMVRSGSAATNQQSTPATQ